MSNVNMGSKNAPKGKRKPKNVEESIKYSDKELLIALKESLKYQDHYAEILNAYDGGERRIFGSIDAWIKRLRFTSREF